MSSAALSTPKKALPSLGQLCLQSARLYRAHAGLLLGYAGWLLLPLLLHVIGRVTLGSSVAGDLVDNLIDVIFVVLLVGLYIVIASSVPAMQQLPANTDTANALHHAASQTKGLLIPVLIAFLLSSLVTLLGLITIVPGIIFATWFAFAPLAVIFDRTRGLAALLQSKTLVRGRFLPVFARVWGFQIVVAFLYAILMSIVFLAFDYNPTGSDIFALPPLPADILLRVGEIALLPLILIYNTLLYLALKNE